jgi:tripartite-type tricarboxylate transporter receptor subunit TctC
MPDRDDRSAPASKLRPSLRRRLAVRAAAATGLAALAGGVPGLAVAQGAFPQSAVKFIVPQAASGSTDTLARDVVTRIASALGQPVVIENRAGANGIVGCELAAKAKPDGYTLLVGGTGTMAINPHLYSKLPYDPAKDFVPVAMFGYSTSVLIVHSSVPANTIGELISWIKASPKTVRYGSAGVGSSPHLTAELFRDMTKLNIQPVHYKGSTPSVVATVSGEVPMMFTGVASMIGHVQGGRVKALSINGPTRSPALPNVPTANESGLPGFEAAFWIGLFAPAGTPQDVVNRLNVEVNRAINSEEAKARFLNLGIDPLPGSPADFGKIVAADLKRWENTIKTAEINPK